MKPLTEDEHQYGRARLQLIRDILSKRLAKHDIADRLLAIADQFPAHSDHCVWEAETWATTDPKPALGEAPF